MAQKWNRRVQKNTHFIVHFCVAVGVWLPRSGVSQGFMGLPWQD